MVRTMEDLLIAAITLAGHPVALVGYIALGVWARSALHAIGYALAWAAAMQLFVTVTEPGMADPAAIAVRLGLRAAGSAVLTLGIFLLYRALRGGSGGRPRGGQGGRGNGAPPRRRSSHLRRVK